MRSFLTLFCESISTDIRTNQVSIFNVVESLKTTSFPATHGKLTFFTYLGRDKKEPEVVECSLTLKHEGKAIVSGPLRVDFKGALNTRVSVEVNGVPIPGPGVLKFALMHGKRRLASHAINVLADESNESTHSRSDSFGRNTDS